MKYADIALLAGATIRLTRFVTSDSLGDWTLVRPAKRWAMRHEGALLDETGGDPLVLSPAYPRLDEALNSGQADVHPELGKRSKLVSGLECPFCVGFWIGAGATASYIVARQNPTSLKVWRTAAGILGLNYLTAHVSSRLD